MCQRDLRADAAAGERLRAAPMDEHDIRRRRAPFLRKLSRLSMACHVRLTGKDKHKGRLGGVQSGQRREQKGGEEGEGGFHGAYFFGD
jgi:hypothetical protein